MTHIEVLGPLRVVDDHGTEVAVRGSLQRRLLAGLVLNRGTVVSVDRLTDLMWADGDAPDGPAPLQSHLFRLRQRVPGLAIEQRPPGYVLDIDDAALDVHRFEHGVSTAMARAGADPEAAVAGLDEALDLWRGEPYGDLADVDDGRIEIERLGELRRRAVEERLALLVRLGRTADALADLEAFVAREPLRERPRLVLMDALAADGRRAEALRVFDDYRRRLGDELGVAPSPELRARHGALLADDERDLRTPLGAERDPTRDHAVRGDRGVDPPARPAQLPRPPSTFVGRASLVAELERRLDEARLVTLLGPGGVGKTRLAVETADRVQARFDDGVVFCDLSSSAPHQITAVVAAAVGLETRSGVDDVDRIAQVLRTDRCLLVLDNCEHVIDAAAAVVEGVLTRTERLVVLATSRERLAVSGEHLVVVPPLSCEPDASGWRSEATDLLADRVRAVAPDAVDALDPAALADLCAVLDGLPLAIELAAARLHTLSITDVREGLDRSISVLRGGRTTVARHRSVTAALDWSYALLDDDGRAALHACAVFAGSFDASDLAAVMDQSTGHAQDLLAGLVECSLARRVGPHFSLLYIVRRFALEQAPADDHRQARTRHAHRMLERAMGIRALLDTAQDATPIAECGRLLADLRDATATAIADEDADTALGLVVALRDVAFCAMLPETMAWGEQAAVVGDRVDHPLTADGFAAAAMGAWKRGDLAEMRRLLERSTLAAERLGIGDRYEVVGTLATEDLAHGRFAVAAERFRRSLSLPEAVDNLFCQANGAAAMVICLAYAHDDRAVDLADRLVAELDPATGVVARAWAWYATGECRLDADPEGASERLRRAVELARTGGGDFVVGIAGATLASLDARSGAHHAAIDQYRWLLPFWLRAGVRAPFWTAMRSVTELVAAIGNDEGAARLLGAVTSPASGHDVIGDDDARLAGLAEQLVSRLGAERFERCRAAGARLDDAAAAEEATAAFDAFDVSHHRG